MSIALLNRAAFHEVTQSYFYSSNPGNLSNRDLLILILEPFIKKRLLSSTVDDILQKGLPYLSSLSEFEISVLFGLGERESLQLMAVFEMSRRLGRMAENNKKQIITPEDARDAVDDLKFMDKEHFVCLFLDTKNRLLGRETISIGTLNASLVHPREVFKAVIRKGACSVVFAHNHPSGDPSPSDEDIAITNRLKECGDLLGIKVHDHIIVAQNGWISISEWVARGGY